VVNRTTMQHDEIQRGSDPEPLLFLQVSDEETLLYMGGFAVIRAIYEAEGYYDEEADGEPEEEDLYLVQVLDALAAGEAAEAVESQSALYLASLRLNEPQIRRLFPAIRWSAEEEASRLVQQYLLALGHALYVASGPAARQRVLEGSAGWSAAVILDHFQGLPGHWQRVLDRSDGPEHDERMDDEN
jgi:hypothetical protein